MFEQRLLGPEGSRCYTDFMHAHVESFTYYNTSFDVLAVRVSLHMVQAAWMARSPRQALLRIVAVSVLMFRGFASHRVFKKEEEVAKLLVSQRRRSLEAFEPFLFRRCGGRSGAYSGTPTLN